MKSKFFIQFKENEISSEDIIKKLKEIWLSKGNKIKDIKEVNIYFKAEENTAYCIINQQENIDISFNN